MMNRLHVPSALQLHKRRQRSSRSSEKRGSHDDPAEQSNIPHRHILHRSTRTRKFFADSAAVFYFLSFIFLILVLIGNLNGGSVLGNIYLFRLDVSNVISGSTPNGQLLNSIARSFGLHDFYQAGLWNFCEGYNDGEGITSCSTPQALYWFNPIDILLNELLAGNTIALPSNVTSILDLLKLASHLMFGFFLTGICLVFVMMFVSPLAVRSRWLSLPMGLMSLITLLLVGAASALATAISIAFRMAATSQSGLGIDASMGTRMFVFMWMATGFAALAFVAHSGMCCCCVSRRDIQTGRKQPRQLSAKEKERYQRRSDVSQSP